MKWDFFDTQKHGVPQSRPRVYIVGIQSEFLREKEIPFPEEIENCMPLDDILEPRNAYDAWTQKPPKSAKVSRKNFNNDWVN